MRLSAHRGLSEDFVKRVSKYPADSPQAKMVGAGNLVYSMRSDLPPEIAQAIATEGLEALAVLPLRDGGRVVAALNVSSHRYPCIEQGSRVALESLVAQAEVAIASLREREARLVAERRLRLAVEGAELGTWVADFNSGTFEASEHARDMHGMAAEAPLTVESALAQVHPADHGMVLGALERTIRDGVPFSCVYRIADASGGERWLASEARVSNEGGVNLLYGIVRDITAERQAQALLIEARDQLEIRVAERTAELERANAALREESRA